MEKTIKGAWIVHHSRKISADTSAPAEYSALDEAGKAAELLMRLGETNESNLKNIEVTAIAKAANLNPRTELPHFISLLKAKRLIDTSENEIQVLGVNTSNVLNHAADIFDEAQPEIHEVAAIALGELASSEPIALLDAKSYIGDNFKMGEIDVNDFLRRSSEIGFVDQEGDSTSNTLLFNGNLFKRDAVQKAARVLSALSSTEEQKLTEVNHTLKLTGCLYATSCEQILGSDLFEKLKAAGVLEVNTVSNEQGDHSFVTLPGAFHKFVNPLVDDTFDMAKALVSALTYGMQLRPSSQGRIISVDWILNALISGRTIGPATAIGADYRVLEQRRVIKLIPADKNMFRMKLLKKEIGQLALKVLTCGDANAEAINAPPSAPMTSYHGPEYAREKTRKNQTLPSRRHTHDILSALRGGRGI
ncbi:MAG: hypothetical protein H6936_08350 [Burkholderiales bacterium]|nr:hypothetical protein [Nitrosomonas sp.]MCP5274842.1 hypothetical protein [Burkholderiales bacterium]